jgi:ATP-binding cassette subfamily B protein
VALCRALLRRTPVLILDEPTSSLDPASSLRVARLLQQWKASGGLIVSVSHNPDFVRLADEIYLMEDGRIVAHGTFEEIEANSVLFRRSLEAP